MKNLVILSFILSLVVAGCSNQKPQESEESIDEPANELQGVWKMTYAKLVYPDTTLEYMDPEPASHKLLTDTHFAFGFQTDTMTLAGGGTYNFDGETYSETIVYHSFPENIGLTIDFDVQLEGNTWHHTGTIQTSTGNVKLEETWVRVE